MITENTPVEFEKRGVKLIVPENMTYGDAILALTKKQKEEETYVTVSYEINAFPLDGAHALMQVLKNRYGWASPVPTPGFFGDTPPELIGLETGPGKRTQVIWGDFIMPGIDGRITTSGRRKDGRLIFVIAGKVKKKHQDEVEKIATEVMDYLKSNSVYKGAAIRLNTDSDGEIEATMAPSFLDLSKVNEAELVLPTAVREQVDTSLFTPIEYTGRCRQLSIPLKRGVLLEGPYGTGKTLTAYVTAKKCQENGWTFIYLDRVGGLHEAFRFAKQYAPSVIFAEDIDRAASGDERTVDIDDILNTIDGIESKGSEIITILTTNHVDKLNLAILRPGRLDSVISIQAPDSAAAQQLMRLYARGMISTKENLAEAGDELAGQIPAVIRECVERAKLHAIRRTKGEAVELSLSCSDLVYAGREMKNHLALMSKKEEEEMSNEELIGTAFREIVEETIGSNGVTVFEKVKEVKDYLQAKFD